MSDRYITLKRLVSSENEKGLYFYDEILVDYNLADYAPEKWFISHGFVPQEECQMQKL